MFDFLKLASMAAQRCVIVLLSYLAFATLSVLLVPGVSAGEGVIKFALLVAAVVVVVKLWRKPRALPVQSLTPRQRFVRRVIDVLVLGVVVIFALLIARALVIEF